MTDPIDNGDSVAGVSDERRFRRTTIARAFRAIKAEHAAERTPIESIADELTIIAGSTRFLIAHILWFAIWVTWNLGMLGLPPFDPYPFGFLTLVVSLEAIFLSIFVLMTQARESAIAELREEVALQVSLRTEAEVTKTLQLIAGLYTRLGQKLSEDDELRQMLQPLDPLDIERELIEQIRSVSPGRGRR
jgi:uncharacterized membrane protein